jgi:hypothetical protein
MKYVYDTCILFIESHVSILTYYSFIIRVWSSFGVCMRVCVARTTHTPAYAQIIVNKRDFYTNVYEVKFVFSDALASYREKRATHRSAIRSYCD